MFLSAKACLHLLFGIDLPAGLGWEDADFHINEISVVVIYFLLKKKKRGVTFPYSLRHLSSTISTIAYSIDNSTCEVK